jgi:histidine triad (HIT) family protein
MACTFCNLLASQDPYLVGIWGAIGVILDRAPVFPGHALVVPLEHTADLTTAEPGTVSAVAEGARRLARGLRRLQLAEGALVLTNVVVSQSVPHLHCHVIPRHRGDGLRGFLWPRRRYADLGEVAHWRTRLTEAWNAA